MEPSRPPGGRPPSASPSMSGHATAVASPAGLAAPLSSGHGGAAADERALRAACARLPPPGAFVSAAHGPRRLCGSSRTRLLHLGLVLIDLVAIGGSNKDPLLPGGSLSVSGKILLSSRRSAPCDGALRLRFQSTFGLCGSELYRHARTCEERSVEGFGPTRRR